MSLQISQYAGMRCDNVCLYVSPSQQALLDTIVKDSSSSSKAVWRARIMLLTADWCSTNDIMHQTGELAPIVWRWQERYVEAGVDRLLSDKILPSRALPLSAEKQLAVMKWTAKETPANALRSSLA